MAEKSDVRLTATTNGWGVDTQKLSGKELSDEQAKIVVLQYLAAAIEDFSASMSHLAKALKEGRFR
jgi:hypothetical protein